MTFYTWIEYHTAEGFWKEINRFRRKNGRHLTEGTVNGKHVECLCEEKAILSLKLDGVPTQPMEFRTVGEMKTYLTEFIETGNAKVIVRITDRISDFTFHCAPYMWCIKESKAPIDLGWIVEDKPNFLNGSKEMILTDVKNLFAEKNGIRSREMVRVHYYFGL